MIAPRVSALALAAGCVLFAAVIARELTAGPADDEIALAGVSPRTEAIAPARRPSIPATEDLVTTILARPIFSATRRPPKEALANAAPTEDALAGARLTGIVIGPDRQVAIFAVRGAKPLELTEGQAVSGWQIDRITPGSVSISGPKGNQTLVPTLDPLLEAPPKAKRPAPVQPRPAPAPVPAAAPPAGNTVPPLPVGNRLERRP